MSTLNSVSRLRHIRGEIPCVCVLFFVNAKLFTEVEITAQTIVLPYCQVTVVKISQFYEVDPSPVGEHSADSWEII